MMPSSSFASALRSAIEADGSQDFATVWNWGVEQRLSFGDLGAAVASGAERLGELHVKAGDRIALLAKGVLDFYVCVLSLQARRATPVALNWRQSPENLRGMIRDAGASVVAVGAPFYGLAEELGATRMVALDGGNPNIERWSWSLSPGSSALVAATRASRRSDEAMVFFTSGSTSRPKPVLHTNETLLWTAENFVFPPNTKTTLCFMPNFHVLMCFQNFLLPLARRVGVSIHGGDDPITSRLLLAACADLRPSTIDTVPFIMADWSTMSAAELAPLAACRAVRSGGAPLNQAVAERLVAAGVRVQTHYGQTEAPGMQLLTVPGAAPSELAIFYPPVSVVEIKLDGNGGQEGELLIRGCRGSSPGYLRDGSLLANSSRTGADGWHRTGDVFRRVKTKAGAAGIEHVMRSDDVILLNTGEMFNPVPMEAAITRFATLRDIPVGRVVVLGQERPAPFLVVEPLDEGRLFAVEELWPAIESANLAEVEYARIRSPGYVLILDKTVKLPRSAKGNVVRPRAENVCATRLDELATLADERLADGLDWDALEAKAAAAGFSSVDAYLAEHKEEAVVGIDSLGIATILKRGQREADRIGDNIKAWTVTAIVMSHWYQVLFFKGSPAGTLESFTDASANTPFAAVSYGVQATITAFTLVDGWNAQGMLPVMIPLLWSVGYSDSVRDGLPRRRVALGKREITLLLLILLYKCFVMPYTLYVYDKVSWKPAFFSCPSPGSVVWFVYALFWYRILLRGVQLVVDPPASKIVLVALCLAWLFAYVEGGRGGTFCNFCTIRAPILPRHLNAFFSFLVDPDTYLVPRHALNSNDLTFQLVRIGDQNWLAVGAASSVNLGRGFLWMDSKILSLAAPYVLGYFFGDKILAFIRKRTPFALLDVVLCYGGSALWFIILASWASHRRDWGIPNNVHRLHTHSEDDDNWVDHLSSLIWHHTNQEHADVFQEWNPVWARPFYLMVCWSFQYTIGFFVIAACVSAPFRMNRCGNAALGKYFSTYMFPWYYNAVGYVAALAGRKCGAANILVKIFQVCWLIFGPLAFVYIWGPIATALVVSFPKFMFWFFDTLWRANPKLTLEDIVNWCLYDGPKGMKDFCDQYASEIVRDLKALREWLAAWTTNPRENLAPVADPLDALRGHLQDAYCAISTHFRTTASGPLAIPLLKTHTAVSPRDPDYYGSTAPIQDPDYYYDGSTTPILDKSQPYEP
ncbi:hypothetical protein CTAYLR_008943 [Chrysophaeum taylorii]|uniref:AMP-dependent synthetase/ligase domain-containing protein n=1 Tax=Chrysophaeum taylorii TaxID=2483200 RepID=A0AAD7XLP6_9STRA|nr:hypothetical protein CTAYLR_008943 [Chrysophaeum taylorii]